MNIGGPPSKPKYISMTDSEQVPWGKGEKNPFEGSEKDPEISYLHAIEASKGVLTRASALWNSPRQSNGVPFA